MTINDPALQLLIDRVQSAQSANAQLCIRGGGTKDFYGEAPQGDVLDTRVLEGISSYEPTELVITARCGTGLAELEAMQQRPSQYRPGSEIPEKSWVYRLAKKMFFHDFGAYAEFERQRTASKVPAAAEVVRP